MILTLRAIAWIIAPMPPTDGSLSDYLTIEQVAVATGRSAISVRRLLDAGTIAASSNPLFARRVVIHRSELAKIPAKQRGGRPKKRQRKKPFQER